MVQSTSDLDNAAILANTINAANPVGVERMFAPGAPPACQKWVTPKTAAMRLGCGVGVFDPVRHLSRYKIPFARLGGEVYYRVADLDDFLEAKRADAAHADPADLDRAIEKFGVYYRFAAFDEFLQTKGLSGLHEVPATLGPVIEEGGAHHRLRVADLENFLYTRRVNEIYANRPAEDEPAAQK